MKFPSAFNEFLVNTVNLNQTRLDQLDNRVQAIVTYLKSDKTIGAKYEDNIPQGSWPHKTIIKPVEGEEFDADFLLLLDEDVDWSANPKEYLQELRAAFKRSATYKDMVTRKTRCVRVAYANDCHVDVVPHLVLGDGRQVIVNYAENKFEDTNPQGLTDWMKEKDDLAGGNLRRVIRLMKYLRDYKERFACPSVIVTTLLGERVVAFDAAERYADVPTALLNLVQDLNSWLSLYPTMPPIDDPGCPGTSFNHRWDEAQYQTFRSAISDYTNEMSAAYHEVDEAKSIAAWQAIRIPLGPRPSKGKACEASRSHIPRVHRHTPPLQRDVEGPQPRERSVRSGRATRPATCRSGAQHTRCTSSRMVASSPQTTTA